MITELRLILATYLEIMTISIRAKSGYSLYENKESVMTVRHP